MNFNEYQKKTNETAIYADKFKERFAKALEICPELELIFNLAYLSNKLGSEVGELQSKVGKFLRGDQGDFDLSPKLYDAINDESGDIMWYVAQLNEVIGNTLDRVACMNLTKLNIRMKGNAIRGDGDGLRNAILETPYLLERSEGVPCSKDDCKYHDEQFNQNCAGIYTFKGKQGDPLVVNCNDYVP